VRAASERLDVQRLRDLWLRDLYMMGDFTKAQYVMRRQALEEELQCTKPPATPALDRAKALLEDFAQFWEAEPDPAERRKLIATLFEQIWQKDGSIVAIRPQSAFARYFTAVEEARSKHPKAGLHSGVTKAGATGVAPRLCPQSTAPSRSGQNHRQSQKSSPEASRLIGGLLESAKAQADGRAAPAFPPNEKRST
jgi:hypothetical protein